MGIYAQNGIDTIQKLPETTIIGNRNKEFSDLDKQNDLTSGPISTISSKNASELISKNINGAIRNYGPGNISTLSIRGGNAYQNLVLWEGISIQNAMLGNFDFSLISPFLFSTISLQVGSGSSYWGSGAISGVVQLENKTSKINALEIFSLTENIGNYSAGVKSQFWIKNVFNRTTCIVNNFQNKYTYFNSYENKQQTQTQASNKQISFLQENAFLLGKSQMIEAKYWYNYSFRNIAPAISGPQNQTQQIDESSRGILHWHSTINPHRMDVKAVVLYEAIQYIDSVSDISDKSEYLNYIIEPQYTFKNHHFKWQVGSQISYFNLKNPNYDNKTHFSKASLFSIYQFEFKKTGITASLREEQNMGVFSPLTGSLGANHSINTHSKIKALLTRNYRFPTLNDLYWTPGGNPLLKPEQSWGQELGYRFEYSSSQAEIRVFNRNTQNWILWTPTGSYWSPKNILSVWSRGIELDVDHIKKINQHVSLKVYANFNYVLSTNQKTTLNNDQSLNKQLIYTPKQTGLARLEIHFKKTAFEYTQSYTSKRYTSTDNLLYLNSFTIGNMGISQLFEIKKTSLQISGIINNIWNNPYEMTVGRPMPLRYYTLSLILNIH